MIIMNEKIDIVLLWVDGNDEKWQMEKKKYKANKGDDSIIRYRDCDNLQYVFRGIEKYAKWVNKIFFITYGHLPKWLNVNNEKLVIENIEIGDITKTKCAVCYQENIANSDLVAEVKYRVNNLDIDSMLSSRTIRRINY